MNPKNTKNRNIALFLAIFFGVFGAHRFYVGKTKSGLVYLFTAGGAFIGWIYDVIMLITGKFSDSTGNLLNTSETESNSFLSSHRLSKALNVVGYLYIVFIVFLVFISAFSGRKTSQKSLLDNVTSVEQTQNVSLENNDLLENVEEVTTNKPTSEAITKESLNKSNETTTKKTTSSAAQKETTRSESTTRPSITTTTEHSTVHRTTQRETTRTTTTAPGTTQIIDSSGNIVFVSRNGIIHSYHSCSRMRNYTEMTLERALQLGYRKCQRCW